MTIDTTTDADVTWPQAAVAGLVAGVAMGLFVDGVMGKMLVIGALWGVPTAAGGWTVHLANSVAFGLGFGLLARLTGTAAPTELRSRAAGRCLALAVVYGIVVWVVAAGVVMPFWLDSLGYVAPSIPNLAPPSLVAHLIYGVVLAVSLPFIPAFAGDEGEAGAAV